MAAQLPYLPPMLASDVNDIANVASATARDVQAQTTGAGKAGVVARSTLPFFVGGLRTANDIAAMPARAAVRAVGQPVMDFGRALFGYPQNAAAPATHTPVIPGSPNDTTQVLKVSASDQGTTINGKPAAGSTKAAPAAAPAVATSGAPAAPVFSGVPMFMHPSTALAISEGMRQQAAYAEQQRQAVLAGAAEAAAAGNPNNASYRYAAALHALPTLSGVNNMASLQEHGAVSAADVAERARASELVAGAEAGRTAVAAEGNKLKAQELRRNVQLTKIGEIVNPDPNTRPFAPKIDTYGYVTIGEDNKPEVYDLQGNRVNAAPGTTATSGAGGPTVGAKVKQADGEYNRGGRTYVVKNGTITEIK